LLFDGGSIKQAILHVNGKRNKMQAADSMIIVAGNNDYQEGINDSKTFIFMPNKFIVKHKLQICRTLKLAGRILRYRKIYGAKDTFLSRTMPPR